MSATAVATQTVESFSLCLDGFDQALQARQSIAHIEERIRLQLDHPIRLLRWAVVKVEPSASGQRYWCEGAYLKSCQ